MQHRANRRGCLTRCDGAPLPSAPSEEVKEFMLAMSRFKRLHRVLNPDCRDVLAVLKSLGYAKVEVLPEAVFRSAS